MKININRHHLPETVPALKELVWSLLDVIEAQHQEIADLKQVVLNQQATIVSQQKTIEEQGLIMIAQQKRIDEQQVIIETQQQTINAQQIIIEDQAAQIVKLTDRVSSLEQRLYGKRSERKQEKAPKLTPSVPPQSKNPHGRKVIPSHLTREDREYNLSGTKRICPDCHSFMTVMGHVTSEQLELSSSRLYVISHRRAKYTCRKCQNHIVVAPMPLQPIDKGLAGPGLLADIIVSKYQDHLPLYRQSQRFKRMGIHLSRSTLCGWMMMGADLLKPLVDRMQEDLLKGHHLFSDDTPIRVLKKDQTPERSQGTLGRFWIYTRKAQGQRSPCTVYQFTPDRRNIRPQKFLKEFQGYLQADAYSGYDQLYKNEQGDPTSIIEVACWAHARRYFYEASLGTQEDSLSCHALDFIGQLYQIERDAKDQNMRDDEVQDLRNAKASQILQAFKLWLEIQHTRVLSKSLLGKAISYTLKNWDALNTYLQAGHLEIDNNRSERGIRTIALGRKNYLFVGNYRGGHAAAILYSLTQTCKQNNINSQVYLQDVLSRISTHPNSKIDELLPYNWKPSNPSEPQENSQKAA